MKYFLVIGCFVVMFGVCFARPAQALKITELMYDVKDSDADREWIEINTESLAMALDLLRLQVGDKRHTLKSSTSLSILPENTVCIIAQSETKFKTDYPSFSGCIFESSFSLTNTGGSVKIVHKTSNEIYHSVEYTNTLGAAGDGNSLNIVNAVLVPRLPSPGGNVSQSGATQEENSDDDTKAKPEEAPPSAAPDTYSNSTSLVEIGTHYAIVLEKPTSLFEYEQMNIPISITRKDGIDMVKLISGNVYISYGDGAVENITDAPFEIKHIYRHASMVTMKIYYYTSKLSGVPDAEFTAKILVKPFPLKFQSDKKQQILITNTDSQDVNLTSFTLFGDKNSIYEFPFGVVISGKGSMYIPRSVHKLTGSKFSLHDKNGHKVSTIVYVPPVVEKPPQKEGVSPPLLVAEAITKPEVTEEAPTEKPKLSSSLNIPLYLMIFGVGVLVSWLLDHLVKFIKNKTTKKTTSLESDQFDDAIL